ncbi:unnamed protein product [Prunus armeniaca]|uniref:Uncharacterized protein n=1 Tax=Prunus armeniaca TaxID=36596 RepID=A0A6J5TK66_PRUAR|nr:unnamed protein product [Prunus armeniaca]
MIFETGCYDGSPSEAPAPANNSAISIGSPLLNLWSLGVDVEEWAMVGWARVEDRVGVAVVMAGQGRRRDGGWGG